MAAREDGNSAIALLVAVQARGWESEWSTENPGKTCLVQLQRTWFSRNCGCVIAVLVNSEATVENHRSRSNSYAIQLLACS
jgi:hypothetical protein